MGKCILFLTPQLPYPPQQGTAIRNYNLMRQAAQRHEVHLLSFASERSMEDDQGPLQDLCVTVTKVLMPRRVSGQRLVSALTSPLPDLAHRLAAPSFGQELRWKLMALRPDVLQVEGLEMAQYGLLAAEQRHGDSPLTLFDAHNAEYLLQRRIFELDARRPTRWPGALYSWMQWQKLFRYEAMVCRRMDRVVACSAADVDALQRLVPGLEPLLVPNGVDTLHYHPDFGHPAALHSPALVFTGKMDFRPNVDAVLWFCEGVLPTVQRRCPAAHLYVVGKDPHPRLAGLARMPGVTLTGYVDDVRPYIAAATVYIVPLLTGGGTRLKVLEAMAMGKALVSTRLGCEGIPAAPGRDLELADGADQFAERVVTLLSDESRRLALGRAARSFVERHFDWHAVAAPLEQVYGC